MIMGAGTHPEKDDPTLASPPLSTQPSWCKLLKLNAIACLVVILGAVMSGCGIFSPEKDDDGGGLPPRPPYPELTDPGQVLAALQLAYLYEDSLEIKAVYDSSYVGTSKDLSGATENLLFSYRDEVDHVAALVRNPLVSVQYFSLGGALERLPSDDLSHPDWAVIQVGGSNFQIDILDVQGTEATTLQVKGSNETFTFRFKPTPGASSTGDTLWKIIEWDEIKTP
jgi:hypothetical protein